MQITFFRIWTRIAYDYNIYTSSAASDSLTNDYIHLVKVLLEYYWVTDILKGPQIFNGRNIVSI